MTRTVRALLVASLLLNVFALSALGGGFATLLLEREHGAQRAAIGRRPIRTAGEALPFADRRAFRRTIRQVIDDTAALPVKARRDRAEAAALFRQEPFDANAVRAALARGRDADMRLQAALDEAAIGFAATLPADERALLASGLERGGPLRHPPAMDGTQR